MLCWGMLTGILSHPSDCDERLFSQQSLCRELLLVEFVCVGCVFEMCIVFVLRFSCSFRCMSSNMNTVYDEWLNALGSDFLQQDKYVGHQHCRRKHKCKHLSPTHECNSRATVSKARNGHAVNGMEQNSLSLC